MKFEDQSTKPSSLHLTNNWVGTNFLKHNNSLNILIFCNTTFEVFETFIEQNHQIVLLTKWLTIYKRHVTRQVCVSVNSYSE